MVLDLLNGRNNAIYALVFIQFIFAILIASPIGANPRHLLTGAALGCLETSTLGQPLEVWKTRLGRMRNETAKDAFLAIYRTQGPKGFWVGFQPRLIESTTKGAILVYSREMLLSACKRTGIKGAAAAVISGMGSGVAQTLVMGPATLLVVAANTGHGNQNLVHNVGKIYREHGLAGFAAGSGPMALRQATNWGSRQGISEALRLALSRRGNTLNVWQEIVCGSAAGVLSTWNQPFEILRIRQQAAATSGAANGRSKLPNMWETAHTIYKEEGIGAFYRGLPPRMLQGVWYTNFLLTATHILKKK